MALSVEPATLRKFHRIATIVWVLLLIPTVLWWKESILWVAIMSVWANVAAHFAAYQGARSEDNGTASETASSEVIKNLYASVMQPRRG